MGAAHEAVSMACGRLADAGEALMRPLAGVAGWLAQSATLEHTDHRPWPVPDRPWTMGQTWRQLLFAHWSVPLDVLRPAVPAPLPLDTFDGTTWIGITPFRVTGLRARGAPPVPMLSSFAELNVRTYVAVDGVPGIWFLSLDAASRAAVIAARRGYRLPYFHAEIDIERVDSSIGYASRRISADGPPAGLQLRYGPTGPVEPHPDGSLERWLTDRYCLYTLDEHQRVLRADIHHPPWPLQRAHAVIAANTMAHPYGIHLDAPPALLHYAERQDVVFWPLRPVAARE